MKIKLISTVQLFNSAKRIISIFILYKHLYVISFIGIYVPNLNLKALNN